MRQKPNRIDKNSNLLLSSLLGRPGTPKASAALKGTGIVETNFGEPAVDLFWMKIAGHLAQPEFGVTKSNVSKAHCELLFRIISRSSSIPSHGSLQEPTPRFPWRVYSWCQRAAHSRRLLSAQIPDPYYPVLCPRRPGLPGSELAG